MGQMKNTAPYKIVQHGRGMYQVLDEGGFDMVGEYVSQSEARHIVISARLREKALLSERLHKYAKSREVDLREFIRYSDIDELRLLIRQPSQFLIVWEDREEAASNARLKESTKPLEVRANIMKTILITGTYKTLESGSVMYNVNIWGQTETVPQITLITWTSQSMTGYDHLIEFAREKFCQYFKVDDYNIIHIQHLVTY